MKRLESLFAAVALLACSAPALDVEANAPPGRYTTGSGTVLDTKTKLTWQQVVAPSAMTWAAAKSYCAGLSATLGGSGWRLPTMKELFTLVDTAVSSGPRIDATYFPKATNVSLWSATPVAGSPSFVFVFGLSDEGQGEVETTAAASVRCVR